MLDDSPAMKDLLDFTPYANALAEFAAEKKGGGATTIGIFGPWGSGKSTLMGLVRSRLEDRGYVVVSFNAWRHDSEHGLREVFIESILSQLHEHAPEDKKETASELLRTVGLFAANVGARLVTQGNAGLGDLLPSSGRSDVLKRLAQFERHFVKLIGSLPGPLAIFVDDVDRCIPEHALEVLDAIKIYLEQGDCIVFVSLDPNVIARGIHSRYGDKATFTVSDYLEKIVQLSFTMPQVSQDRMAGFVEQLCADISLKHVAPLIARAAECNPRKAKRLRNSLKLVSAVVRARQPDTRDRMDDPAVLAKLLILQIRWPDVFNRIMLAPRSLNILEERARTTDQRKRDELEDRLTPGLLKAVEDAGEALDESLRQDPPLPRGFNIALYPALTGGAVSHTYRILSELLNQEQPSAGQFLAWLRSSSVDERDELLSLLVDATYSDDRRSVRAVRLLGMSGEFLSPDLKRTIVSRLFQMLSEAEKQDRGWAVSWCVRVLGQIAPTLNDPEVTEHLRSELTRIAESGKFTTARNWAKEALASL